MFLLEAQNQGGPADLVFSATDLVTAAECEYRLLRRLDEKLGRSGRPGFEPDAMLKHAATLGDLHEQRVLRRYLADYGPWNPATGSGVYDVAPAENMDRATLVRKHEESVAALRAGADVVFQAAFFDGQFHGRSDFLVRTPAAPDPSNAGPTYAVFDSKLARHAKTTALLQLAAYADQLIQAGISVAPAVSLILGTNEQSDHRLADLLPVFHERRRRFLSLIGSHRSSGSSVAWGDDRTAACGRCDYCQEQVELHRDLLLVAGMSLSRRKKLRNNGILTIDQLAVMEPVDSEPLARLQAQARLQTGTAVADGTVVYTKDGQPQRVSYQVLDRHSLGSLPAPDPGDIFFDFEGDPLWQDPGTGNWGLEYLFGVLENPPVTGGAPLFRPFWAHTREQERAAFSDFLSYLTERRRQHPGMHVYHYANYEKAALRRLSLIHVVGEDAVDGLLREGVLVDLYDTVRHSLRISERSYSIKKLEPLYMGGNLRTGDVQDAAASVVAYAEFCAARDSGDTAAAEKILAGIADYNEYDCLSTLGLRDWLLSLAAARGAHPGGAPAGTAAPSLTTDHNLDEDEQTPAEKLLLDHLAALPAGKSRSDDDQAVAMVAAAVGYHRREDKQFWWGHFDRLNAPPDDWASTRDVFLVQRAEALSGWEKPTARSSPARTLLLHGTAGEASDFKPGPRSLWFRMYDAPLPDALAAADGGRNHRAGWFGTELLEAGTDGEQDVLTVREKLPRGSDPYPHLPVALTPGPPVSTSGQREALAELARAVGAALPGLPRHAGLELLRRAAPRMTGRDTLPAVGSGPDRYIDAITAAVLALDRSYLAVQGPPGTGKTHVGSHVIANVVAQGWKVGVVGQSHAVVENMLDAAITKAGVPPELVAKKTKREDAQWTHCTDEKLAELLRADGGCLVGGTAWTMTGACVPPDALDLLVIDEAGQFSLANTLATTRAAKRLLLLGDPQQLPQVTQGTHPEPVDDSALGWLSAGHAILPPDVGYFLADSWRMQPELCRAVSELAYDGKLTSAPAATVRRLAELPAGVECVMVEHTGNSTSSPEEAEEAVRQAKRHLGLSWTAGPGSPVRPLAAEDILVVAAYNAQVNLIRRHLRAAGLGAIRVGTVDKFQGQEAPVVLVSMACSAAAEAPRGMDFLLNRNRINVAVSRGQWRAVLIRSPQLTWYLPARPDGLKELGAFIGLCATEKNKNS